MSRSVRPLFEGDRRPGVGLGAGHLDFGDTVISLSRPGAPRLPNGIEGELEVGVGEPCWIGEGCLEAPGRFLLPGPVWEARPRPPRIRLQVEPRIRIDPIALAGRGAGLTPSGDDLLCGFAAGLVLWHGREAEARSIVAAAAPRTTRLAAELLRCAARGELPEPAHTLLESGDPEPLRRFGHSSGRALLLGLSLAC